MARVSKTTTRTLTLVVQATNILIKDKEEEEKYIL